jgi:hypothetical protein
VTSTGSLLLEWNTSVESEGRAAEKGSEVCVLSEVVRCVNCEEPSRATHKDPPLENHGAWRGYLLLFFCLQIASAGSAVKL